MIEKPDLKRHAGTKEGEVENIIDFTKLPGIETLQFVADELNRGGENLSKEDWDATSRSVIDWLRKQYRNNKEDGWSSLPYLTISKYGVGPEDGTHRIVAALAEGAKTIRCVISPTLLKNQSILSQLIYTGE